MGLILNHKTGISCKSLFTVKKYLPCLRTRKHSRMGFFKYSLKKLAISLFILRGQKIIAALILPAKKEYAGSDEYPNTKNQLLLLYLKKK